MKKNWFIRHLDLITSFYFGAILSYAGIEWDTLMFYAICVPVIIGYGVYFHLNKD